MARLWIRDALLFYEEIERRKQDRTEIREMADVFGLPDNEFIANYKVNKEMVRYLCEELNDDLAPRCPTGYPVEVKVLASLRLLLDGHYQRGNGNDALVSIAQTTVSKYLEQFIGAVNARLKPLWLVFPGTEETRHAISGRFEEMFGLPRILGAIDCTHMTLFSPPGLNKAQYKNHHGTISINTQLICDADCRILHVNANYPGRVHDQFIFNNSVIKDEMIRLYDNGMQYHLLGDSGYALEPWLLTPIRNALIDSPEDRYSKWHCQTRNIIERTNGYLKGTFRLLGVDRNLHYLPAKTSQMIYASCTLYNIMKHFRVPLDYQPQPAAEQDAPADRPPQRGNPLQIARQIRNNIVNTYFA